MRIVFGYHPNEGQDVVLGTLDGRLLAHRGRFPVVDGVPLPLTDEYREAFTAAFEDLCLTLWAPEWSTHCSRFTGVNRRTVTRDRVYRFGLAPWLVKAVVWAAEQDSPKVFGKLLLAADLLDRSKGFQPVEGEIQDLVPPGDNKIESLPERAAKAAYVVGWCRARRAEHLRERADRLEAEQGADGVSDLEEAA